MHLSFHFASIPTKWVHSPCNPIPVIQNHISYIVNLTVIQEKYVKFNLINI